MSTDMTLHQRRRNPTLDELQGIPWLPLLLPHERARAVASLQVGDTAAGDYVCRVGKPVTYWLGVVEGLLKMSSDKLMASQTVWSLSKGQTMRWRSVFNNGERL